MLLSSRDRTIWSGVLRVWLPSCLPVSRCLIALIDAFILRSKFRIAGKLIGAQLRQVKKSGPDNVVKGLVGLPLSLSRYEVDVGLREGFVTVYIEDLNDWILSEEDHAKAVAARVQELNKNAESSRRESFALSAPLSFSRQPPQLRFGFIRTQAYKARAHCDRTRGCAARLSRQRCTQSCRARGSRRPLNLLLLDRPFDDANGPSR